MDDVAPAVADDDESESPMSAGRPSESPMSLSRAASLADDQPGTPSARHRPERGGFPSEHADGDSRRADGAVGDRTAPSDNVPTTTTTAPFAIPA